jgi:hypothetical protein
MAEDTHPPAHIMGVGVLSQPMPQAWPRSLRTTSMAMQDQ